MSADAVPERGWLSRTPSGLCLIFDNGMDMDHGTHGPVTLSRVYEPSVVKLILGQTRGA